MRLLKQDLLLLSPDDWFQWLQYSRYSCKYNMSIDIQHVDIYSSVHTKKTQNLNGESEGGI